MKIKIRRRVFETNSSSTHSIQIITESIEDAYNRVWERIKERYKDNADYGQNTFSIEDNIQNDILIINGISLEDGDEDHNVYYIIQSFFSKIQFMGMFINAYAYYLEGYNREEYTYTANIELLKETEPYKKYVEMTISFLKEYGYYINDINFDIEHDVYLEKIESKDIKDFTNKGTYTTEDIETLYNNIMQKENVIIYRDEAYNPYNAPSIYVI